MLNFDKLFLDHSIEVSTYGKHYRAGWTNVVCPFCSGSEGYHLGFNQADKYCKCYRCGWKPLKQAISKLLRINEKEVMALLAKYSDEKNPSRKIRQGTDNALHRKLKLPEFTDTMRHAHWRYLKKRNFNPRELVQIWGLLGTSPMGSYANRIVAPIFFKGELVSYQCRDITDQHELKYKTCRKEEERVHHKHIVYGFDLAKISPEEVPVVIVEGITDVWRLGPGSIATFGLTWTGRQAALIAKEFPNAVIIFDAGSTEAEQADKLYYTLVSLDIKVDIIDIKGDPGDLDQASANQLMREIRIF